MVYFTESQKFRQPWLLVLMLVIMASVGYNLYTEVIPEQDTFFVLFSVLVPLLVFALLMYFRLDTSLSDTGIHYRMRPFTGEKIIRWEEIDAAWLRTYKPFQEYGGWGLRYSWKHGRAINVRGNKGLQLRLKTGKKLLIGTQKPEAMEAALDQLRMQGRAPQESQSRQPA